LLAASFAGGAVAAGLQLPGMVVGRDQSDVTGRRPDRFAKCPLRADWLKNSMLKPTLIADSFSLSGREIESMMGPRQVDQAPLFYEFSLERHVPGAHLLRAIDRFVDLSEVRSHLAPFYSSTGRPSIDPELLVRMLLVGYCYGIRSERRLCDEVHLHLAYRWFCRLGLDGEVPDHSTSRLRPAAKAV
jgi:hypothetical protein